MFPQSTSLVFTAGLASLAMAAPTSPSHKIGTFSVPQVRNTNFIRHGPSALAKAYLKFGATMPQSLIKVVGEFRALQVSKIAKRAANGSALATPEEYDIEYLTPVSIGTPAQTLNLDFDSGSSDLWVFSSATTQTGGQAEYDPSSSTTSKKVSGASWDISYGDGSSSSGIVYKDVVNVGGVSFTSQAVEAAETVSSSFLSDSSNDGLLGLAFSSINTVTPTQQKTFFDNIRSKLASPVWTADLKHDTAGTYGFGSIDASLHTGKIAYTDVDSSSGYWGFTADSYTIGNGTTSTTTSSAAAATTSTSPPSDIFGGSGPSGVGPSGGGPGSQGQDDNDDAESFGEDLDEAFGMDHPHRRATSSSITGIADTGTTLALLPTDVVTAYYAQVSSAENSASVGGYVFSCAATLPDFTYTIGSVDITIPGTYINYAPADETGETCYGGIQVDTDIGFAIFGDIALKAAYVVFEDDGTSTPRLGFAAKTL